MMDSNKQTNELRSDEAIAELLSKAPPRAAPPTADEALVREAVHAEWQEISGGHVRRRNFTAFALAASVLLAVFATLNLLRAPVGDFANQQMATVQKHFGDVRVNSQSSNAVQTPAIDGGDLVQTGPESGLALAWHDGGSLRIDENTIVEFEAEDRIYLRQGRIYFDSEAGPLAVNPANGEVVDLLIRTDLGVVRHLGTQYMTEVSAGELTISIREGVVSIDGTVTARATAGQQFAITGSGALTITDTDGIDDWEWVERTTPAVNLNGRTVSEALAWVSRESGRSVQYARAAARAVANDTGLRGDFDMEPSRALEIFMLTVDLNARIEGDVIMVIED